VAPTGCLFELTQPQQRLISTIYAVLRTEQRWPNYRYLEELLDWRFSLDLEDVRASLPVPLTRLPRGNYPVPDTQAVELTIEGLMCIGEAQYEAELVFRLFRLLVEKQNSMLPVMTESPRRPCVSFRGLSPEWSVDPGTLRRAFMVAAFEPWVGSYTPSEDGLTICASRLLRRFRGAQTLGAYLEMRRAHLAPEYAPTPPRTPPPAPVTGTSAPRRVDARDLQWDVFISHAHEDKEGFVRPLAEALREAGVRVWYDDFTLTMGDSLRRSIDQGLTRSQYGVVVLSPNFFGKHWPQTELDGLAQRESDGHKVILPVLHRMTIDQVRRQSPTLADRVAVPSESGIPHVVEEVMVAMGRRARG